MGKNTLSKEELELLGYTNVVDVDERYYISIVELHARLSMIDGYSTYNGSKPTKGGK